MLIFNAPGVIGVAGSVFLVWLLETVVGPVFHLPEDWGPAYTVQVGALIMALYALAIDRSEEPTLFQGYRLNLSNFFLQFSQQPVSDSGVFYRPDRRLCFFIIPLATAPLFAQLGLVIVWIYAVTCFASPPDNRAYALYFFTGLVTIGLCWIYARFTTKWRNLPDAVLLLQPDSLPTERSEKADPR